MHTGMIVTIEMMAIAIMKMLIKLIHNEVNLFFF